MDRLLLETQKPVTLEAGRELRHLLKQVVQAAVPDHSVRLRILLCLSEAVTNLALHADPKANRITMRFGRDSRGWWLEILDDGAPWDPTEHEQADVLTNFELTENGRGTALLRAQCDQMEYNSDNDNELNRLRLLWLLPKQHQRPTILVVEDDNSLRRIYAIYLAEDFEVQTASNGHEALEQLNANKIDLVLSDINMPEMSGLSLREELNQTHGTDIIPFIFLTALDTTSMQERAADLGIDDYLVKPVDKAQLIHTIDRVLGRSRQIYQQLTDRIDKRITSALTPKLPDTSHGWRLRVASRHTGIGGGDLLLHRNSEQQLMLALIDIMGHDDSAKFFAYAYGGYLRGLMHTSEEDESPSRLLERLSECALKDGLLSQTTLTSCVASLSTGGRITLASAGHPTPIRLSKAGAVPVSVGGMLPGLLTNTTYQAKTLQLASGERIALYTDGLFESAADNKARKELESGITKILTDTINTPIEQSLQQTMSVFDELAGTPPKDDALLLLMEPIN
jgi:DNA-binding response OmpR family regulator/anti-sigma regulatory factor (Ser/Thr protein kinase)